MLKGETKNNYKVLQNTAHMSNKANYGDQKSCSIYVFCCRIKPKDCSRLSVVLKNI